MVVSLADLLMRLLSFMAAPWQSGDTENIYHKRFDESDQCKVASSMASLELQGGNESLLNCVVDVAYLALQQREVLGVIPMLHVAHHLEPTNEPVICAFALALGRIGKLGEGFNLLHSVVGNGTVRQWSTVINWAIFAQDLKKAQRLRVTEVLEKSEQEGKLNDTSKALLHHALATAYEDSDPSKSFSHTTEMNMQARVLQFPSVKAKDDACQHPLDIFAAARTVYFTKANLHRWRADLLSSDFYHHRKHTSHAQPLFIVGTQGSGASLLERILDSHPNVRGLGEPTLLDDVVMQMYRKYRNGTWVRPDHVDATFFSQSLGKLEEGFDKLERQAIDKDVWSLKNYYEHCSRAAESGICEDDLESQREEGLSWARRQAQYVVTSQAADFMHIGAIRLLFPDSPIIHVRRDLRDVALANLRKLFSDANVAWTFTLRDIVNYLRAYKQTMDHWGMALPEFDGEAQCASGEAQCGTKNTHVTSDKIIHIRYEDLVQNPEDTLRSLLQQLKLNSSDDDIARCLSYLGDKPFQGFPTQRTEDAQDLILRNTSSWRKIYGFLSKEDQEDMHQLEELNEASELREWLFK